MRFPRLPLKDTEALQIRAAESSVLGDVPWRASGKPLLFDGYDQPKAAFDAAIKAAVGDPASSAPRYRQTFKPFLTGADSIRAKKLKKTHQISAICAGLARVEG